MPTGRCWVHPLSLVHGPWSRLALSTLYFFRNLCLVCSTSFKTLINSQGRTASLRRLVQYVTVLCTAARRASSRTFFIIGHKALLCSMRLLTHRFPASPLHSSEQSTVSRKTTGLRGRPRTKRPRAHRAVPTGRLHCRAVSCCPAPPSKTQPPLANCPFPATWPPMPSASGRRIPPQPVPLWATHPDSDVTAAHLARVGGEVAQSPELPRSRHQDDERSPLRRTT